ncbi:chemotaxis protein CheW [Shewanella salipaludis]|uniref:Chemotaxis protein CheW n=1 Tax=Shewanella salipaludis TaxID=2723052 RepID=A0A972G6U8_9GAMM|nr:chemotaxis protein CheW [Shewanella salipaludis]NMH65580.1 chemotaxis protein CheW [Shewanella salipaludis]
MSKSVDQTVFDFFQLLLQEPETGQDNAEAELKRTSPQAGARVTPAGQRAPRPAELKPDYASAEKQARPQLDKKALEKLFAPMRVQAEPQPEIQAQTQSQPRQPMADEASQPGTVAPALTETAARLADCAPMPAAAKTATIPPPEARQEVDLAAAPAESLTCELQDGLDDEFQVLFFKVAGLTLAVPLVSLGGIVKIEKINHIIGRPDWFMGVQSHRESQLNIVDTGAWVMPEKYDATLAQKVSYQYLVMLEGSNWGLACESLVNAVKINKSQVNWRSKAGKRPWLAGVVREQMCGILHVQSLIGMLDAGLGCQDSIG